MFYEELYPALGKLFYYIAATDGKVQPSERKSLQQLIQANWTRLESSTDRFGTDQAHLIGFAFDFEEAESSAADGLSAFIEFYNQNKSRFTPDIISNILQTAKAVATAYRGKSNDEGKIIDRLINLLSN